MALPQMLRLRADRPGLTRPVSKMLRLRFQRAVQQCRVNSINLKTWSTKVGIILVAVFSLSNAGRSEGSIPYKSQEVSDADGLPVLIKHLPEWENYRERATFAKTRDELTTVLGNRPVLDAIDFTGGTEAVTAPYGAGNLLIVEYTSPQTSIDADGKFTSILVANADKTTVYRRIGNYNAFVFDATDAVAANALLDQVKYQKTVQWLGRNPFEISAERNFVLSAADLFLSTVLVILAGIGIAVFGGLITGYIFFLMRERKRAGMATFTDAGGMTRLNLDGFTPEILPKKFLKE